MLLILLLSTPPPLSPTAFWSSRSAVLDRVRAADQDLFLRKRIEKEVDTLCLLDQIPAQHAILILRWSFQHRLRHLLRTLDDNDEMLKIWRLYDDALLGVILKRRGNVQLEQPLDRDLVFLPVKKGGLGLGQHEKIAQHALAAATEAADQQITLILGGEARHEELRGQSERVAGMVDDQYNALVAKLSPDQRAVLCENQAPTASYWLRAIPFDDWQTLSGREIAVGLHARTLTTGQYGVCRHCHQRNELGHDEHCDKSGALRTIRHESIKNQIAQAIRSVEGSSVIVEPPQPRIGPKTNRTDLRVSGPASMTAHTTELDISVVSMFTKESARERGKVLATEEFLKPMDQVLAQCRRAMERRAAKKIDKYKATCLYPFFPVVFSAGGLMAEDTTRLFSHYAEEMHHLVYKRLLLDISIGLLRNRTRCFTL